MPRKKEINKKEIEFKVPWFVWAIVILGVAGIVFYLIFSSMGTFVYKNLAFTKERYSNDLIIYHYSYFLTDNNGDLIKYNMYMHTDPRKNNIPFNADIEFNTNNKSVIVGIDTDGLRNCSETLAAIHEIDEFLMINGFNITQGLTDLNKAKELNVTGVTCETHPNDVTILIKNGAESSVSQQGKCYTIEVGNCEVFAGVEKFMVEAVAQAKEKSRRI